MPNVNIIAVLIGAVILMVLGVVWYMPQVMGKMYLAATGKTMEQVAQGGSNTMVYAITFVGYLVASFALFWVVQAFGATQLIDGAAVGALVAIGFVGSSTLVHDQFDGPGFRVWMIFALYQLAGYIIVGAVFAIMR